MNLQRYFIAGTLSLTVHIAMLWSATENKAYAIPLGATSTAVSLNFATMKPASSQTEAAQAVPEKKQPVEKQQAVTQKPQKKNAEKKASNKKTAKKVAAKQQTTQSAVAAVEHNATSEAKPKEKAQQSPQASVAALSAGTEKPVLVDTPLFQSPPAAPRYPRLAKRKGIEGTVTYEVWLDEQGRQIKLTLKDSSGTQMLDTAALQAIEKWKFSAHKINGQAVAQRVFIPIRFKLD